MQERLKFEFETCLVISDWWRSQPLFTLTFGAKYVFKIMFPNTMGKTEYPFNSKGDNRESSNPKWPAIILLHVMNMIWHILEKNISGLSKI